MDLIGALAIRPGWLGWVGNTLNLGVISVTCPHLLGLAYNCCDLFLLSSQIWNVLSRLLHCLILVFLSLIHIILPFGSCSNFSLTNKCRRLYVCTQLAFLCVCALADTQSHMCRFLTTTTDQHGRVLDCQMCRAPRRWHITPWIHTAGKSALWPERVLCLTVTWPWGKCHEGRQREPR